MFETGIPLRLSFYLKGTDVAQTDMLCGGEVEVFVEPLWPGNEQLIPLFKKLTEVNNRGGDGWLATVVAADQWKKGISYKFYLEEAASRSGPFRTKRGWKNRSSEGRNAQRSHPADLIWDFQDDWGRSMEVFLEPVNFQAPFSMCSEADTFQKRSSPLQAGLGSRRS